MNALHWFLIALAAVFGLLMLVSRKLAFAYARFTTLVLVGTVILMPFAWLICAAFKDKAVLNEYSFLPPPSTWRTPTVKQDDKLVPVSALPADQKPEPDQVINSSLNFNNFRRLFEPRRKSLVTVAVAWALQQPGITSAIIGASKPEQLDASLAAVGFKFEPDERELCDLLWYSLPRPVKAPG